MSLVTQEPKVSPFRFLDRLPTSVATDAEVGAYMLGGGFIAPGDSAAAPKFMIGKRFPKGTALNESGARAQLTASVNESRNAFACVMMRDECETGLWGRAGSFGMPGDLKFVAAHPWNKLGAPALDDVRAVLKMGAGRYDVAYARLTASPEAIREMVFTPQFISEANQMGVDLVDRDGFEHPAAEVASLVLGLHVEAEDRRYATTDAGGRVVHKEVLPPGTAILSAPAFDGDPEVMDFAEVAPLRFWTEDAGDEVILWAEIKGFPRRKLPAATATLSGLLG